MLKNLRVAVIAFVVGIAFTVGNAVTVDTWRLMEAHQHTQALEQVARGLEDVSQAQATKPFEVVQRAHAGALTDYAENKAADAILRGQSLGAPASMYVALYTTCPTDSTAGTEVSGGSYARVAVTSNLTNWYGTQGTTAVSSGTSGTISNAVVITFAAPTANWGVVNCWGLADALTAGNLWIYSALTTPKTINNGDAAPSFAVGAATFQVDN